MNTRFFDKTLLAAATFLLAACAGNAPCPSTDVPQQEGAQTETAAVPNQVAPAARSGEPAVANPAAQQTTAANAVGAFDSQALNTYRLNTPDNVPVSGDPSTGTRSESEPSLSAQAPDPYTAFPALAATIFAHADSLYAQGYVDSASAYLERLRIIKPLWNVWFTTADSMLNEFGKTRAEKAKEFEPLVFQIQNMNRAQAAYSMVAETADSLMALTPGDSLVKWAKGQKAIAYKNTLAKAKKEYDSIKALADNQAQFAIAQKKAEEFQMRYRDFEFDLHIQALIDYIAGLAAASSRKQFRGREVLGKPRSRRGTRQSRRTPQEFQVRRGEGTPEEAHGQQAPQGSERQVPGTRQHVLQRPAQDHLADLREGAEAEGR